jgi:hypothetical protein
MAQHSQKANTMRADQTKTRRSIHAKLSECVAPLPRDDQGASERKSAAQAICRQRRNRAM